MRNIGATFTAQVARDCARQQSRLERRIQYKSHTRSKTSAYLKIHFQSSKRSALPQASPAAAQNFRGSYAKRCRKSGWKSALKTPTSRFPPGVAFAATYSCSNPQTALTSDCVHMCAFCARRRQIQVVHHHSERTINLRKAFAEGNANKHTSSLHTRVQGLFYLGLYLYIFTLEINI